ncbi:MAG: ABC transporter substrate-binding protein [Desulfobacteria bacterium]
MKRLIHLAILIALVFLFNGCDQQPAIQPSGKKIKVGIIGPFSGSDLAKGKDGLKGIKAAMQLQPYLENGDGVELVVEDDQNEPSLTVKALEKLTESDKVSAILILSSSDPVLEIAPIADTYKMPILALIATHPDVTINTSFVSQLCFDDTFQGTVAALFIKDDLLIDTVAVFSNPDSSYSSYLAAQFIRKFKSLGGQITETVSITQETDDYTNILKNIRNKKTELLYVPIRSEDLIQIVKALKKMRWKPEIMGSDGLLATVLTQHKEESGLLEGILATDLYSDLMPLTSFGKEATKSFDALFDGRATTYAALGAEGYALLLNAMNRCNTPGNRACINQMIHNTSDFTGVMGKIWIKSNGKAVRPLVINTIKHGRLEFVVKVY